MKPVGYEEKQGSVVSQKQSEDSFKEEEVKNKKV